ncbi:PaaI family thioesterase [Sphingosinithalassobacter sp. LHW66-3]|uniref:PaaI family thioesterase n=1 Tax=Sphingosinithalassobacter sp. LHW66-3 TaxID=3424718 RepID=UPI003D6BECF8
MTEPFSFRYEDDPDAPGWKRWELPASSLFNSFIGPVRVRVEVGVARVRWQAEERHANLRGHVHGGALLGFLDICLFAAARGLDVLESGPASTVDLTTHFLAGAPIEHVVEARVELTRETGRFLFLRGLVVQGEESVASFSALIRKPSRKPA